MARLLPLLLFAALLSTLTLGDTFDCTKAGVDTIPSNGTGTLTCNGYRSGVEHSFASSFANCSISMPVYNQVYGTVTLFDGNTKIITWTGSSTTSYRTTSAFIKLTPSRDYTGSDFQISYTCVPAPPSVPIVPLVSDQSQIVSNRTHGGFIYLSLGPQQDGALQSYSLNVFAYRGLRPPAFFVSMGRLPTLESYDWTNDTVADGKGGYNWQWSQPSPRNGYPVLGMFLYGNFGGVNALGTWTLNYETIPFNTPTSKTIASPSRWCGQFQVTPWTSKFELQVSRDVPGGYPIFYVAQGVIPTASNARYALDTNKDSFAEVTVPSPYYPNGPNPGQWVVHAVQLPGRLLHRS